MKCEKQSRSAGSHLRICGGALPTALAVLFFAIAGVTTLLADTEQSKDHQPASGIQTRLIGGLSSTDPQERQRAAKALRARGPAVAATLKDAMHGNNPATAMEARAILGEIESGVTPALERDFAEFVKHYADAEPLQKATIPYKIADSGTAGLRAIVGLYRRTRDAELLDPLSEHRHESAILMLGLGMDEEAAKMVGPPSESDLPNADTSLGAATAFLMLEGKVPEARSHLKQQPRSESNSGFMYLLDRARGDLPAARADAERIQNRPRLLDEVLARQHDWATLATRLDRNADGFFPGERFGFLCRYQQLSGNLDGVQRAAQHLIAQTDIDFQRGGALPINAAYQLFMCGYPDKAIDLLIKHHELAQASWYLPARVRFDESLSIVDTAKTKVPAQLSIVRLNSARSLRFMGRVKEARMIIQDAQDVQTAHDCGFIALEREFAAQLLARPMYRDNEASQSIFYEMGIDDWATASVWFRFLLNHYGQTSVSEALGRVRQTFQGSIPTELLARLGQAVLSETPADGSTTQSNELSAIGELLADHNCGNIAAGYFTRIEQADNSADALCKAGDFQADRGDWDAAQDDYALAFELNPLQAAPLYLRGWALTQMGQVEEGKRLMHRGEVLPLCDAEQRKKLLDAMVRHRLLNEARHEVEELLNLNGTRAYECGEAVRWAAGDARKRDDFASAATLLLDWALPRQQNGAGFLQPLASMEVPAMIHQANAEAMAHSGHFATAMAEAKAALSLVPLDPDLCVELVNFFSSSGDRAGADELYREQVAYYRALVERYHDSGSARELLGSIQVRCGRDLVEAREFAAAAVALEPGNPAFVQTLAKVDFACGNPKSAADQMRRCIELDPEMNQYRQQLATYEAGAAQSK